MNKTDAKPIPKLLTIDKMLLRKLGIKFKFSFDAILEDSNKLEASMLWLSKKTLTWFERSTIVFSILLIFKMERFCP